MKSKGLVGFGILASFLLFISACKSEPSVRRAQSTKVATEEWLPTIEALQRQLTELSSDNTPGPASTPSPAPCPTIPIVGRCAPTLPTPIGGRSPSNLGSTTTDYTLRAQFPGQEWVRFYANPSLAEEEQLGQLKVGSSWLLVSEHETALELELRCWMADSEVARNEEGRLFTAGKTHTREHAGGAELVHPHCWSASGFELGWIPEDIEVRAVVGTVARRGILDENNKRAFVDGREYVLVAHVYIEKTDG